MLMTLNVKIDLVSGVWFHVAPFRLILSPLRPGQGCAVSW
jgi:hypothetical protein